VRPRDHPLNKVFRLAIWEARLPGVEGDTAGQGTASWEPGTHVIDSFTSMKVASRTGTKAGKREGEATQWPEGVVPLYMVRAMGKLSHTPTANPSGWSLPAHHHGGSRRKGHVSC
jgi:hypothetical protein